MSRKLIVLLNGFLGAWLLLAVLIPTLPLPLVWAAFLDIEYGALLAVLPLVVSFLVWPRGLESRNVRWTRWAGALVLVTFDLALLFGFFLTFSTGHYFVMGRVQWVPGLGGVGKRDGYLWHVTPQFNVKYDFDEFGWRKVSRTHNPRGTVLVVGCSFPFGWGVSNEESFSAIADTNAWPDLRVVSLTTPGMGPWEGNWIIKDYFSTDSRLLYDRTAPPVAVFYCWLEFHLERTQSGRDLKGKDSVDVAVDLLWEMKELCEENGVKFTILHLTAWGRTDDDPVLDRFVERGGDVVDLRPDCPQSVFPDDGHPTPEWHAAVAEALAKNPHITEILSSPPVFEY